MAPLYHPRPGRWPQVTLGGLLTLTSLAAFLSATALPGAIQWYQTPEAGPTKIYPYAPGPISAPPNSMGGGVVQRDDPSLEPPTPLPADTPELRN